MTPLSNQGWKGSIKDVAAALHVNMFLPQAGKEIIIYFKPLDERRAPGPDSVAAAMAVSGLWQMYSWLPQLQPTSGCV